MKRSDSLKSNKSSVVRWLNKYSILILGFTSVSIVTSATIALIKNCSPQIYSSRTSLDRTAIRSIPPSYSNLIWLYGAIIIGFSSTPWLLTHFLKQIAISSVKKTKRIATVVPSSSIALKPNLSVQSDRLFPTSANFSYRISSRKKIISPLTCTDLTSQTSPSSRSQNITLPFGSQIPAKK